MTYIDPTLPYNERIKKVLSTRIFIDSNNCWIWTAAKTSVGYGELRYDGELTLAHRVSWIVYKGPIPNGLIVCHTCDIRACINPDHLFLGTHSDNTQDMLRKNRNFHKPTHLTRCKRGHEFTPENTYIRPEGRRMCRICMKFRKSIYGL